MTYERRKRDTPTPKEEKSVAKKYLGRMGQTVDKVIDEKRGGLEGMIKTAVSKTGIDPNHLQESAAYTGGGATGGLVLGLILSSPLQVIPILGQYIGLAAMVGGAVVGAKTGNRIYKKIGSGNKRRTE